MIGYQKRFLIIVFAAGFALLSLEILSSRILSPVFGGTIFVWTSLITATLAYLSLGYYLGGNLVDKTKININKLGILILFAGIYTMLIPLISKHVILSSLAFGVIYGPLASSFIILSIPMLLLGMVSPSIIKLSAKSMKNIGSLSGNVFAIGTLGSITGALFTGFFFLPVLGLSLSLYITGFILILSSFLLIKSNKKYLALIAIFSIMVFSLSFPKSLPHGLVESFDTHYGKISVVQRDNNLLLYENRIIQTSKNLETNETSAFYIEYFRVPFEYQDFKNNKSNAMMIGLAGGSISRDLISKYNTSMDIVEINPKMLEVSKKYFNWNDEASVYFDDARHFLHQNNKKYDVIIIDIGFVHPSPNLFTLEAFDLYKSRLNEDGFLVFHLDSQKSGKESKTVKSMAKTLKQVFPVVVILGKDVDNSSPQVIAFLVSSEIEEKSLEKITKNIDPDMGYQYVDDAYISEAIISTDDNQIAEFYEYFDWTISNDPEKINYIFP